MSVALMFQEHMIIGRCRHFFFQQTPHLKKFIGIIRSYAIAVCGTN